MAERALEHRTALRRLDTSSFMFKHWVLKHSDRYNAPKSVFRVLKHYKDPLSRLVREAVVIQEKAVLNIRSEWGGYTIGRLTVDKSEWQSKKEADLESEADRKVKAS